MTNKFEIKQSSYGLYDLWIYGKCIGTMLTMEEALELIDDYETNNAGE